MKQTWENYHKAYFQTDAGKASHARANQTYWKKLRAQYPGMGINKAQKARKADREQKRSRT